MGESNTQLPTTQLPRTKSRTAYAIRQRAPSLSHTRGQSVRNATTTDEGCVVFGICCWQHERLHLQSRRYLMPCPCCRLRSAQSLLWTSRLQRSTGPCSIARRRRRASRLWVGVLLLASSKWQRSQLAVEGGLGVSDALFDAVPICT